MKRYFALVVLALVVAVAGARAEGQDDQYVRIYNVIQEADSLAERDSTVQALAKYMEAQAALQSFQRGYPEWSSDVVKFRLNYLASKIAALSAKAPAPSAPVAGAEAKSPGTPGASAAVPEKGRSSEWQAQINGLQEQVRQLQADRSLLEAKLKEALAAQPAAVDPRELAKAEEKLKGLQKENDLLKAGLAEKAKPAAVVDTSAVTKAQEALAETHRQLGEQKELVAKLTLEKEALQMRLKSSGADSEALTVLRTENQVLKKQAADFQAVAVEAGKAEDSAKQLAQARAQVASLQSDKEVLRLEKTALEEKLKKQSGNVMASTVMPDTGKVGDGLKELQKERDDLQKKLDAANKEIYGRKGKAVAGRLQEMESQVTTLKARLEILEARQVPFTVEELALLKQPEAKLPVAAPAPAKKTVKELPAGAGPLVAEAQRYFAMKGFGKAEQKYLEVLQLDDKNAAILANLAVIQMELNRLDEAEKNLTRAIALAPDDAYALSTLGHLKFRQAKYDEAQDALSRAAKLDPQSAEIQNRLGITLSQKGMRGPAETALRKAIQLQPGYADAHHNLAVVYLSQQPPRVELARWHYQKALAAGFPKNAELERMFETKKTASLAK